MRRLFIMRKDLNMSPGKLAAQVSHCAEAYWTNKIKEYAEPFCHYSYIVSDLIIDEDIFKEYICGSFVKTICEAKNKNHLLKARDEALEYGFEEGRDFGLIYDNCLTELEPEEENGTTLTGIWFKPLPDDVSHIISKKYQLYK